jgi:hypothetical protein
MDCVQVTYWIVLNNYTIANIITTIEEMFGIETQKFNLFCDNFTGNYSTLKNVPLIDLK